MALTVEQIRDLEKKPVSRHLIGKAISHEIRLRFHTETTLSRSDVSQAVTEFFDYVRAILPKDKFQTFGLLFRYPVKTVPFTGKIFDSLEKIFDGRNKVFSYNFKSEDAAQDWEQYRSDNLQEADFWRTEAFEAMKGEINSVMVVDLPTEQTTTRPEPYSYMLPISSVIDFKDGENEMEWIKYHLEKDRIAVIDDGFYRVFNAEGRELKELLSEVPHDIGYCPARFFWTDPLKYSEKELKESPLSKQLAELDWILFFETSKRHLDLYAPYPIYSGYAQDCDYENDTTKEYCSDGFIKNSEHRYILSNYGGVVSCPVCSKKKLSGVGSFIEIPMPSVEEDIADIRNPIQITSVDKDSLEWNVTEVNRLKENLYIDVTGHADQVLNKQAINEDQVRSNFESRTQVLNNLKQNFEKAQQWRDNTICILRYGSLFVGSTINYGTEFYLYSPQELLTLYDFANKAGMPDVVLDNYEDQYYETLYRHNKIELERIRIIKHLDPFRHSSDEKVKEMYSAKQINYDDFFLKINFTTLLLRFERENGNILTFAGNLEFDKKIDAIREGLISYIEEPEQEKPPVESGSGLNNT